MSDLVAFLNARLDEDEAMRDRMAEQYAAMGRLIEPENIRLHSLTEFTAKRLLREVEAKRRILARHKREAQDIWRDQHVVGEGPPFCPWCSDREEAYPWPCPDVRALAAVYADHPGYDPAWAEGC